MLFCGWPAFIRKLAVLQIRLNVTLVRQGDLGEFFVDRAAIAVVAVEIERARFDVRVNVAAVAGGDRCERFLDRSARVIRIGLVRILANEERFDDRCSFRATHDFSLCGVQTVHFTLSKDIIVKPRPSIKRSSRTAFRRSPRRSRSPRTSRR